MSQSEPHAPESHAPPTRPHAPGDSHAAPATVAPVVPALPSSAAVLEQIRRLELLEGARLSEAERLAEGDSETLCRELQRWGWLTQMQADCLLQGQGDSLALCGCVLLAKLGAGGMGMVYRARHVRLGQVVALKLIHHDRLGSDDAVRRFRREAAATSRLAHVNVIRALESGHDGATDFLILELVEGTDLARLVAKRGPLPAHEACEYVRQIALGLQHAHELGLIHRDVKPSNVMLARGDEGVPVVKLLDLGLSRGEVAGQGGATSLTDTGVVMGTPDYVAPEQIRDSKRADARSDLYSLGCTFYFLLTGRPPFPDGTIGLKLVQHQMDEPKPVESLRPETPAAVAAIVRKLMAKNPDERYQTAGEVAAALRRILKSANWSPAGLFDALEDPTKLVTAPRRHAPWSLGKLALSAVIAVILCGVGGWFLWKEIKPKNSFVPPPSPPELSLDRLSAKGIPPGERFEEWQPAELVHVLGEHRGRSWDDAAVAVLAFSADGKVLYSANNRRLAAWDAKTLRPLGDAPCGADVRAMGTCRGDKVLFVSDHFDGLTLYSLPQLKPIQRSRILARVVSPDGRFALPGFGGTLRLAELSSREEKEPLAAPFGNVLVGVAFAPDGKSFAHADHDGSVVRRETATGKEVGRYLGHKGAASALAFSVDGKLLVAGGGTNHEVRVWDVATKDKVQDWEVGFPVTAVAFSPAFVGVVALGTAGRDFVGYRLLLSGKTVRKIEGLEFTSLTALAVSPDGKTLARGDTAGRVELYDLENRRVREGRNASRLLSQSLLVSPNGSRIVVAGAGGGLLWYDEASRGVSGQWEMPSASAASLSPDGGGFFLGNENGEVQSFNLDTGKFRGRSKPLGFAIRSLAVVDAGTLAVAGESGKWCFLFVETLKVDKEIAVPNSTHSLLASGGTGRAFRLVAMSATKANADKRVLLNVHAADGKLLHALKAGTQPVTTLAVSKDGEWLAAGGDKDVRLWQTNKPETEPTTLATLTKPATAVAFFPDGQRLAIADNAGVVQIRTRDGALVKQWQLPGPVPALAIDSRGKYLVIGNGNGTAYVLRLAEPR